MGWKIIFKIFLHMYNKCRVVPTCVKNIKNPSASREARPRTRLGIFL